MRSHLPTAALFGGFLSLGYAFPASAEGLKKSEVGNVTGTDGLMVGMCSDVDFGGDCRIFVVNAGACNDPNNNPWPDGGISSVLPDPWGLFNGAEYCVVYSTLDCDASRGVERYAWTGGASNLGSDINDGIYSFKCDVV